MISRARRFFGLWVGTAVLAACAGSGGASAQGPAPHECPALRASDVSAIIEVVVKPAPPPASLTTTTPFCGSYATADGTTYLSVKSFTSHVDYANEIVEVSMNRRLPNPKRDVVGLGLEAVLVERRSERDRVLAAWDGQHGLALFAPGLVPEDRLERLAAKGLGAQ